MRKRSQLLEVSAAFVATIALASAAHATVGVLDSSVTLLEAPEFAQAGLSVTRGGFGATAVSYGTPHE